MVLDWNISFSFLFEHQQMIEDVYQDNVELRSMVDDVRKQRIFLDVLPGKISNEKWKKNRKTNFEFSPRKILKKFFISIFRERNWNPRWNIDISTSTPMTKINSFHIICSSFLEFNQWKEMKKRTFSCNETIEEHSWTPVANQSTPASRIAICTCCPSNWANLLRKTVAPVDCFGKEE